MVLKGLIFWGFKDCLLRTARQLRKFSPRPSTPNVLELGVTIQIFFSQLLYVVFFLFPHQCMGTGYIFYVKDHRAGADELFFFIGLNALTIHCIPPFTLEQQGLGIGLALPPCFRCPCLPVVVFVGKWDSRRVADRANMVTTGINKKEEGVATPRSQFRC